MKKITKILSLAMCLLTCATGFLGCTSDPVESSSQAEGKNYKLTVWAAQEDQELIKKLCNDYAAANPNNTYKFFYGVQGENDAADKVLNDVESGPDVFSFANDQINKLISAGALARLGGNILEEVTANNTAGAIDAATFEIEGVEQMLAFPATGDNYLLLFYDKSKVGGDDLNSLDALLTAAQNKNTKVLYNMTDSFYSSTMFFADPDLQYEVTYGEGLSEQKITINYDNEDGQEIANAMYSYVQHPAFLPQGDDSKVKQYFSEGSISAAVTGTWNARDLKEILGENFGVCKLPTFTVNGQQVQLSGFSGYKLMGVNNYSQNKGEALRLAAFLTNEQSQIARYEARGFAPTNLKAIAMDNIKNDPIVAAGQAQTVFNRTQKGVPSTYWTPVQNFGTAMVTSIGEGETLFTQEQILEQLQAMCENIRKSAN